MKHDKNHIEWADVFSIKSIFLVLLGVVCALFALKGFMMPNHFLDGGVTGISILIHEIFHFHISIIIMVLSLPFFFIARQKIGATFAVKTVMAVSLLAIALHFVPIPTVTDDKILIALFGGFLIGLGIGFVIRSGAVLDGFEVIVHFTNKRLGLSSGEMVLFVNSVIFLLAAINLGIESAMYSILTYFTAVKSTEYVVDGFEEFIALNIVSGKDEEIKKMIVQEFGKAISVYKGKRGFLPESFDVSTDCDIIVTIVSRLEIYKIQEAVKEVDPNAFLYVHRIKEVKGGVGKHTEKAH